MTMLIKTLNGIIKSLQAIARHLEYGNDSGYKYSDSWERMIRVERDRRALGERPAIISEDTCNKANDINGYSGEKGRDYWRGAI